VQEEKECPFFLLQYVCSHHGKITLEKQWSKTPQPFALQATRKDILVHDPSFTQYRTLPELFPVGSVCFMLGQVSILRTFRFGRIFFCLTNFLFVIFRQKFIGQILILHFSDKVSSKNFGH
jgi:hypothetical protein